MHKREDEYQLALKSPSATENSKLTAKALHEQEHTKLIRQIQCAKKVIDICTSLEQYFLKYVTAFVEEYGVNSDYKKEFADENLYIIALVELIEACAPLLAAEKKANETGIKKTVAKTSQELFPLTLPIGDAYKMSMISHQNLNFNYMPFLPGEEFCINSLNMLLSGKPNMHPIRFIKVMGRSRNNDGKVAYYQTSSCFTQNSLSDVIEQGLVEHVNKDTFSAMLLSSVFIGLSDAPPESFMVNWDRDDGSLTNIKLVGVQNDRILSAGGLIFRESGTDTYDDLVGSTCNTLFLLPQMDAPLSKHMIEGILQHNYAAEDIVSSWMRELYMQNQRYQSLITSGFNSVDLQTLQLPVRLPTESIVSVYNKMVAVIDLIAEKGESLTNHDIFALFFPKQAAYYLEKRAMVKTSTLKAVVDTLMVTMRGKVIDPVFLANKNKGAYIQSLEELSQEFVSSIDFARIKDAPSCDNPKKPNVCSIIADNLAFLPFLCLTKISEGQLRDMFLTSSTKSNTKEVILYDIDPEEALRIRDSQEVSYLIAKHNVVMTIKD
jgi:hypothetical protein